MEPEVLVGGGLDALVIATPPDRHHEYYRASFAAGLPFFSEANILTPRTSWFDEGSAASGAQGFPSATWRFHPLVVRLRDALAAEPASIATLHHHYGGYLPAWHPWEPYEEFYAGARRATCAAREMVPFELEWLCWVLGPVRRVNARRSRRTPWRTDIDDTYELLLQFERGATGSLIIELHQIAPVRRARVSGVDFNFALDLLAPELERRTLAGGISTWTASDHGPFDFETVYRAEIVAFAEAVIHGAIYPKTWADDRHLSDVLVAAEHSDRQGTWVDVASIAASYEGWMEGPATDVVT